MKSFDDAFIEEIYSAFPHLNRGIKLSDNRKSEMVDIISRHGYEPLLHEVGSLKWFMKLLRFNLPDIPRCKTCNGNYIKRYKPGKKYCSLECYKKDPDGWSVIAEIKRNLYSDPEWKEKTEQKKRRTNKENHGVDHPMQSIDIREKHQKNCFQAYDYRGYESLRGNEKHFVDFMFDKLNFDHSHLLSGNDALRCLDVKVRDGKSYRFPDFFVTPFAFVEIKGDYTFEKDLDKTTRINYIMDDLGFDYYLVVIDSDKDPKFYSFRDRMFIKECPFDGPGSFNSIDALV